jgi:pimeloyl-ACP methyl ester carboxylesterase
MSDITYERLPLRVGGVDLSVATARRDGELAPILFLHGFGSTKEDYVDMARHRAFAGRPFLAYDAPGCGETACADASKIAVLSFIDIEGNIAPEDCFLSRQVITHSANDFERFFDDFIERARRSPSFSAALYAASLRHKVRPGAVRGIFESMVQFSDHGDLMTKFLALPCPRMFMYGERNSALSYLSTLAANGIDLAEISDSSHWPMYSNPVAMWEHIAEFLTRHELP